MKLKQKWLDAAKNLKVEIIKVYNFNKVKVRSVKNPEIVKVITIAKLLHWSRINRNVLSNNPNSIVKHRGRPKGPTKPKVSKKKKEEIIDVPEYTLIYDINKMISEGAEDD